MKTTYLELSDGGTQHKFYAVTVHGAQVTLAWGRIGRRGTRLEVEFGQRAEAQRYAAQKLRRKVSKGYRPAIPGQRPPLRPPPRPADPRQLCLEVFTSPPPLPRRRRRRS